MRKNIFDIYNELHANDKPKVSQNETYVKIENPETVKTDPEPKTNAEDVGKSSLSEERGENLNEV